jgi:gas vesicle protein
MAAQLLPIVKAIAPYIAQIAAAAIPAFTSKKEISKSEIAESNPVVTKQIEELQAAASQNAQSVQMLAEKLQQAIQDLEGTVREADKKIVTYKFIIFVSLSLSVVSLAICIYVLLR